MRAGRRKAKEKVEIERNIRSFNTLHYHICRKLNEDRFAVMKTQRKTKFSFRSNYVVVRQTQLQGI